MPSADNGAPLTHRRVWRLATPVILANLSIPLMGAVDTAVMGHLPDAAFIGGVALGGMVFSCLYWAFSFLRLGTTGQVAQAFGRGDTAEIRAAFFRAAAIALAIGLVLVAVHDPLGRMAFWIVEAPGKTDALARRYYEIRIWAAPCVLFHYVAIGWLFGLQRMGTALVLMIAVNLLNAALAILFVPGLGWGIEGVATATLIAEACSLPLGAVLIWRTLRGASLRGGRHPSRAQITEPAKLANMLRINRDIFLRTLLLLISFAWFTLQGAALGETLLAANAVLMNFQTLLAYGLDGFAHAAEALIGAAVGRRDRTAFRDAVVKTSQAAIVIAVVVALFYGAAGYWLIGLFTDIPAVRASAREYLPWLIASPIVSVWGFQLDGICIGATRTAAMRNAMFVVLPVLLAAGYLLVPAWGNHGLWLAFMLFMAARAFTLLPALRNIDRDLAVR